LWDSVKAELNTWFFTNLALGFCFWCLQLLFLRWLYQPEKQQEPRPTTPWQIYFQKSQYLKFGQIALGMLAAVGIWLASTPNYADKELLKNPFWVLLRGNQDANAGNQIEKTKITTGDIKSLRFGNKELWTSQINPALFPECNKCRVVMVILESVGSLQALDSSGGWNSERFPELKKFENRTHFATQIVNVFPSTVRSHMPIFSGGRTITYGSVFHEFTFPFDGPTLPKVLNGAGYETAARPKCSRIVDKCNPSSVLGAPNLARKQRGNVVQRCRPPF
jgi:hypothetical protein